MAELRKRFETVYREAAEIQDRNAMAGYIQAKDARKAELQ